MTRPRVASSLGSCVVLCLLASSAIAGEGDPCTSDGDCGQGYACDLPPVTGDDPGAPIAVDGGTSEGTGGADTSEPEQRVGRCERAPTPCTTDADCDEYYVCNMDVEDSFTGMSCDAEGNCTTEVVEPEPATEGVCEGEPISCTTSSQCPTASVCLEGVCAFDLVSCLDDADCPSGYQCFAEEREICFAVPCAAGEVCDVEPECETTTEDAFCLPVPVACTPETGCEGGDICYDIPDEELPGAYAALDLVCWPQGLVGVVEGYVVPAMDGTLAEGSSAASDAGGEDKATLAGIETGTGNGAPVASTPQGDDDDDDAAATDDEQSADSPKIKSQDGGCTVTPAGSAPGRVSGWLALALMAALALSRRRR